ncbi:neogenin isoform X1 [Brachionus plicatilis]|uniref:Neogenin isoform X1 n=1 Tax=Brachionus plicatilis TaxID=10195 RepID=A0A3M7PKC7_BRAPC|nr:neogenin isoform X1 [Brachionus plicatilis]
MFSLWGKVFDLLVTKKLTNLQIQTNDVSFLKIPNDQTVTEGSTVKFSCQSSQYTDRVTWLKDGVLIENNYHFRVKYNGDLEIQRVLAEDEGFYVCSIGNYDNIKYAQAKLTVNIAASFIKRPVDVTAIEGNYAEFYCKVAGKPEPKVMWKKDGALIEKKNNQNSIISDFEFYQNNELLRINNLNQKTHSGSYTCVAVNPVNTISSDALLQITQAEKIK